MKRLWTVVPTVRSSRGHALTRWFVFSGTGRAVGRELGFERAIRLAYALQDAWEQFGSF